MRRVVFFSLLSAAAGLLAWLMVPREPPKPDWTDAYDLSARPVENIPSGTVIDRIAPPGWSHLIIKSQPRVRPSELGKVNAQTARMATWMFTAFLADVRPDDLGHYRLQSVAMGLGASVLGRDTILTPETATLAEAELSPVFLRMAARTILTKGYEVQRLARIVAQGPTMTLLDTPVWFRCGGKNKLVRLRYALLVNPETGNLNVLVWGLDADSACAGCFSSRPYAVWLRPDTVEVVDLVPDPAEFQFGIPSDSAFAVDELPEGRERFVLSNDLRSLAEAARFTPGRARELEDVLQQLVEK